MFDVCIGLKCRQQLIRNNRSRSADGDNFGEVLDLFFSSDLASPYPFV